jgi:hypothetical protein
MKNFKKFLEEVSIKGNPAIPGGGEEKDWIKGVEAEPREKANGPREIGGLVGRIMELLRKSNSFVAGKEAELSKLAQKIMLAKYENMARRYGVEFDIELVRQGDAKKRIEKTKFEKEEGEKTKAEKIEDVDTQMEIHKRKIANLMTQGYAKNTKHILHEDITKEGLEEIYGNRWQEIFAIWDEMTKIADKLDWSIPIEHRQDMIRMSPDSAAGACRVEWKPEEAAQEEEEVQEESEDGLEIPEEKKGMTPVVRAVGIDFPMLLHEATKGFFEFLSIIGLPEDEEAIKDILSNTGVMDEPEDWKYGPEIAKQFRDFVNINPKCNKYANLIEEVWYYMLDRKNLNTEDFLKLVRGILAKTNDARVKVDKIIDAVADYIEQWEEYDREMERYKFEMEEYEKQMAEFNKRTAQPQAQEEDEIAKLKSAPSDYSRMSKSQLNDLLNAALDDGDYVTADLIIKEIDKK